MFQIMEQKNIKSIELSDYLGVNKTVVSSWKKRNTDPPASYTVQICELLGISIEYYITGTEKENSIISEKDKQLIRAYHAADQKQQQIIDMVLDLKQDPEQDQGKSSASQPGEEAV
jgi:transcriptional regulator with XRE-family HTH domain